MIQAQRLAIARALLSDALILLLEEGNPIPFDVSDQN